MTKPIKVLYIMGTARSGSTILEIILAANNGVFGAGELTSIIDDGFIKDKLCSCGASCYNCDIWGRVLTSLSLNKIELEQWKELQRKVDWHDGFLRQYSFGLSKTEREQYKNFNYPLLKAIHKETSCEVIIDSSKYAGRVLALSQMKEVDLKVICLTRSPSGLMFSFQKPNKGEQHPKSTLSALLYYMVILPSLRMTMCRLDKKNIYSLCYENLRDNPTKVLTDISQWSGLNLSEAINRLSVNQSFDVGHIVTGNRLRKAGAVSFQQGHLKSKPTGHGARLAVFFMAVWKFLWRL